MLDVSKEVQAIASQFLKNVRPSGPENIMSICPFHRKPDGSEEHRPSFSMNTYTGVYFCHTCQTKGTLRQFLQDVGVSIHVIHTRYSELLNAARNNAPAPPDPLRSGVFDMQPIPEGLLGLFDGYTNDELLQAGFDEATLQHFEVGYDRWHERVTYPIRDIKGQIVGISGRSLDGAWPKYKIYDKEYETWDYPSRLHWDKRKVLYNMGSLYPTLIKLPPPKVNIMVVEGFKAAMWIWQAGFKDVVALLGAYMSWEQRWMLERLQGTVYLFLDNNDAGLIGTVKAGESLLKTMDVRVVEYPEGLQDNEDAQPDMCTPDDVFTQVGNAPTYLQWLRKQRGDA